MIFLGLVTGSVLNVNPVFTHNPGRHLDDLTSDDNFLFVQLGAVSKNFLNGMRIRSRCFRHRYLTIFNRSSRFAPTGGTFVFIFY